MEGYLTVTEYAKSIGKDPGNIRKMLIAGRLQGEKIGNQWAIKEGTEYPADGRISSGKYHNWRKQIVFNANNKSLKNTLDKLVAYACKIYGNKLEEIVLYGSYARGTQTDESDVDIALLLNDGHTESMHDAMTDIVVDLELESDKVLSVISVDNAEFLDWGDTLPFYKNIKKEGIVLWKTA